MYWLTNGARRYPLAKWELVYIAYGKACSDSGLLNLGWQVAIPERGSLLVYSGSERMFFRAPPRYHSRKAGVYQSAVQARIQDTAPEDTAHS